MIGFKPIFVLLLLAKDAQMSAVLFIYTTSAFVVGIRFERMDPFAEIAALAEPWFRPLTQPTIVNLSYKPIFYRQSLYTIVLFHYFVFAIVL